MAKRAKDVHLDSAEMFTLDLLHDFGYEFGNPENHPQVGYEILSRQNYKYAKEVLLHGNLDCKYQSLALDLLNFADMRIDKWGNYVTFEQRLEDIRSRKGENSIAYTNAKKIVDKLKNKKNLL